MRKHLSLTAITAICITIPFYAQGQQMVPMQQCMTDTDCIVVQSQCGQHAEYYPLNRAYLDDLAEVSGPLCSVTADGPSTIAPSCVAGACQARLLFQERIVIVPESDLNYGAITRQLDEELAFTVPEDDTSGEFTAYDLPDEVVNRPRIGMIEID